VHCRHGGGEDRTSSKLTSSPHAPNKNTSPLALRIVLPRPLDGQSESKSRTTASSHQHDCIVPRNIRHASVRALDACSHSTARILAGRFEQTFRKTGLGGDDEFDRVSVDHGERVGLEGGDGRDVEESVRAWSGVWHGAGEGDAGCVRCVERCQSGGVGGDEVEEAGPAEDAVESVHAGGYQGHVERVAGCFGGVVADCRCVR
jgi:hypothetical protein